MATMAMHPRQRSMSSSQQTESTALLEGIKNTLPGLDRFLKIDLRSQTLSGEARTELDRLTSLLVELEKSAGDHSHENGTADLTDGRNGDVAARSDTAFSGFLAHASIKGMGFVSWNRRWGVLRHGESVLRLFRTRADGAPLSELDIRGCRVSVADPHECGEKALTLKITNPDSDQPLYFCTYVESEYQKCMHALATATGERHGEDDFKVPTTSASRAKAINLVSVSAGRETPEYLGSSVRSTGSAFLDAGQDAGIMDSTYDVPRPAGLGVSREKLDGQPDAQDASEKRNSTKWSVSGEGDYSTVRVENDLAEEEEEEMEQARSRPRALKRDPSEAVPDLPPRSYIGHSALASPDSKQEESTYESLPFEHGSNSDSGSEHDGIYEDLEPKESDTGYRSTDSAGATSILGWFRRSTADRASGRVERTRRHRRSVAALELSDCEQDGYLFKRNSSGLTWKRRWCVLKERALYYYRSRDDKRAQNTIILPSWQISAASEEVKRPFAFKLSHEGMPAYFFAAENENQYHTWMEVIKQSLRIVPGTDDTYDVPPKRSADQQEADKLLKAVQGFSGSAEQEDDAMDTYQVPRSYGGGQSATPNADHPLGGIGENEIEESVYNVPRPSSTDREHPPPLPSGPRPLPRKGRNQPVNDDSPGDDAAKFGDVPLPGSAVDPSDRNRAAGSAYGSSTNNNEVDTAGNFERGGVYNSLKKGARKLVGRTKSTASSTSSRVIVHSTDRTIQGCLNVRGSYRWSKHFCELRQQRFFVYKGMTKDEKAIVHEIRVLGMAVERAEKETKRKNSFCLVKRRGGHHARAVYFFCDDEEDYKHWFLGLAEATMIKIQAVEDISSIHTGGKAAPNTVGLAEARKRFTPPEDNSVVSPTQADGGQAERSLRPSNYESGVTLKTSLPGWLQDEMRGKEESSGEGAQRGAAAAAGSSDTLLFQGQLEKRNGPALWHQRHCVIENGNLACYAQKGSQIPTQVQPLANCTVTGSNKDHKKNVFKIVPPSPFATLYFSAENQKDLFEWVSYVKIAASVSDSRGEGKGSRASVAVAQSFRASGRRSRGRERTLSTGDAPRRGLFSRIRSWSVENLSFGRRPNAYDAEGSGGDDDQEQDQEAVYGGSMSNFERNAVSLGNGPFRRSRRGAGGKKKINSKTSPVNSGQLRIEETSKTGTGAYLDRWCEVKQLTLSIFDQAQDRRPMLTVKLPGSTVMVHHADLIEDRVIQLTPLAGKQMLRVKVPGSEETFRSWLECFRTAASLAGGTRRSWRDSFRRKRRDRAQSPEQVLFVADNRRSLVGDTTSAPRSFALYEHTSSDMLPDVANKFATDLNALTAEHDEGAKPSSTKPPAPQPPSMKRTLPSPTTEDRGSASAKTPPRSSSKPRAPAVPMQRADATDLPTPTGSSSANDLPSVTSPRRIPNIPQRKESIPSSPHRSASTVSLPTESPAKKSPSAPRFDAHRSSSSVSPATKPKPSIAPKPAADRARPTSKYAPQSSLGELCPLPDSIPGVDPKALSNLKQRYNAKADAITTQGNMKQAALSKERANVHRQQSDLQQQLNACRSRMNSTGDAPPMEMRRQEAELQNRAGVLESKLSRINDQMMRITTELKSAVDRLERERDGDIKRLKGDAETESAM